MPSSDAVAEELADVVVRVLGCDPVDVVAGARLKEDLGADSLTIVEIGEELGRRFGLYLSDGTIDSLRTVQDAIDAIVDHDGSAPPKGAHPPVPKNFVAAPFREPAPGEDAPADPVTDAAVAGEHLLTGHVAPHEAERHAWSAAKWLAFTGVVAGALLALGVSAVVNASGMDDVNLPPLPTTATAAPTPTETTPAPTPTPTPQADATPEPSLTTENPRVSPGERFVLSGALPEVGQGATLQVQVRESGTGWDDFPVQVRTRDGGAFKTELYTSRTGEREFRLLHEETGRTTPTVKVRIG